MISERLAKIERKHFNAGRQNWEKWEFSGKHLSCDFCELLTALREAQRELGSDREALIQELTAKGNALQRRVEALEDLEKRLTVRIDEHLSRDPEPHFCEDYGHQDLVEIRDELRAALRGEEAG